MALVLKDRVKETSTTAGTGTITLNGAVAGFQSFSAVGNANTTYYAIVDPTTGDWEVGLGTYTASGTTLSRDTVLSSSNSGLLVSFVANPKDVFVTYPSEKSVYEDASNVVNATSFGAITATSAALNTGTVSTTPASNTDIANKQYVDTLVSSGITYHTPVKYEVPDTTGNLNATYNNGASGVGATLTNAGALVAFTPDGTVASSGDRIIVYNQTNQFENGVYTVTTVGSGSVAWVLTRATDADTYALKSPNGLGNGDAFFITSGATGAGETYVCNTAGVITFGTTAITFAQISDSTLYTAGTGLTLSGTQFSITNTAVTAATYGSASAVPVFAVNAQGQITGVTNTNIAINGSAVSGNISGSAGSVANALTFGTYLTGGTYNGSAAVTATVDATSANTASKVVARDASGNFSAGTITATLNGTATSTASATNLSGGAANQVVYQSAAGTTAFATAPSASNQVLNWNGSAFTWSAGTISGVPLGSNLNSLTAGTYLTGTAYNGSAAQTWAVDATSANTASKVVARDASGNFSAGTITAALSGNATTATSATSASTSTTQGKTDASTNIATTAFSKWMFATSSTGGTLDWNNSSNTIPGVGTTLLLGTATNGPGGGNYYHPFNIEYSGINGTGNVTQMAIAYGSPANELYMRGSYSGSWSSWVRFLNSSNYNSYAPTLTGGGASGTWNISITGSAGSAGSVDYNALTNKGGGTGSYITSGDYRAPIFYDSNDTAYYGDFASTSKLLGLCASDASGTGWGINLYSGSGYQPTYGLFFATTANFGTYGGVSADWATYFTMNGTSGRGWIYRSATSNVASINTDGLATFPGGINMNSAGTALYRYLPPGTGTVSINAPFYWNAATGAINIAMIDNDTGGVVIDNEGVTVYGAGDTGGVFRVIDEDVWQTNGNNVDAATCFYVNQGTTGGWGRGNWEFYGSARAPIFYDYNNTGYYLDPTSVSNVSQINMQSYLRRNTSAAGYLEGNYPTSTDSNSSSCIYTIGGAYQPGTTSLGNMYGIGYTVGNGTANPGLGATGWGLYVAAGGTSRIFLDGDVGYGIASNSWRAPIFYDSNNTGFYVDPAPGTNGVSANFQGRIQVGTFNSSQTNSGEAWLGRASDRNSGTFTVQLGGGSSASRNFEVVDYAWTVVLGSINSDGNSFASSSYRAPIFYDSADTGYYVNPNGSSYLYGMVLSGSMYFRPNTWIQFDSSYGIYWPNHYGAHLYPNTGSSYTQIRLDGQKNGYDGMWLSYSAVNGMMYDSSGNGGVYREANGRWYFYYHLSNDCMGIGTSTTNSTYGVYCNKGAYFGSRVDGTIFYDANNTAYYCDPNSTSRMGTINADSLYSYGNVTAYSDERLKKDWEDLAPNFVEQLAKVKSGTYTRIDSGERQAGVGAQSLQVILKEAVSEKEQYLGVNYGNAALVSAVELAKYVTALEQRIQQLEARL